MSMMVSFVLSFFPRDVLDEILNLIGSVSEGFPSYSSIFFQPKYQCIWLLKGYRTVSSLLPEISLIDRYL